MNVTQNNDGSLTVEISAVDLSGAMQETLQHVPVGSATLIANASITLAYKVADAIRAANVAFDQAITDATSTVVQNLVANRATAALAAAVVVAAPIKVGP